MTLSWALRKFCMSPPKNFWHNLFKNKLIYFNAHKRKDGDQDIRLGNKFIK